MTAQPDPQLVREIARKHIRSGRTDIGTTIVKHFGDGVLGDEEFFAWEYAVHQAWQTELRAVSWPDEQPQDERDADVRAVAAVVRARPGHEEGRALNNLAARFHGRIAELEARDMKDSEQ